MRVEFLKREFSLPFRGAQRHRAHDTDKLLHIGRHGLFPNRGVWMSLRPLPVDLILLYHPIPPVLVGQRQLPIQRAKLLTVNLRQQVTPFAVLYTAHRIPQLEWPPLSAAMPLGWVYSPFTHCRRFRRRPFQATPLTGLPFLGGIVSMRVCASLRSKSATTAGPRQLSRLARRLDAHGGLSSTTHLVRRLLVVPQLEHRLEKVAERIR